MKRIIAILLLCLSSLGYAGSIPVYSALEHSQSILSHIEQLNDAMVQLEQMGVLDEQLVNQLDSLMTQYEQFEQQIRNATALGEDVIRHVDNEDLIGMLKDVVRIRDRVVGLDPRNPAYDDVAQEIIYDKYGNPTIRASDYLRGNQEALDRLNQRGAQIEQGYSKYADFQKFRALNDQLAGEREETINKYEDNLFELGDDSLLQTNQLNTLQTNLMLKQQELIIKRLDELQAIEERREQEKRAMEREAYEDKIRTLQRKATTVYRVGENL